jgi:TonB family protein
MSNQRSRNIGITGSVIVHIFFLLLLLLITVGIPHKEEETGVPVMLGNTSAAQGNDLPEGMVDVDVMPARKVHIPQADDNERMIVQNEEKTVAIKSSEKKNKKVDVQRPKQQTVIDQSRQDQIREEQERKRQSEAAQRMVSSAFGKGSKMSGNYGTAKSGTGTEGSPNGNSAYGARSGKVGYGTFSLGDRDIIGSVPKPAYTVQDEGKVVVNITVNPSGQVIATSINRMTNTSNPALQRAAEEAARKARFNNISGVNNDRGTITYYFKLK